MNADLFEYVHCCDKMVNRNLTRDEAFNRIHLRFCVDCNPTMIEKYDIIRKGDDPSDS